MKPEGKSEGEAEGQKIARVAVGRKTGQDGRRGATRKEEEKAHLCGGASSDKKAKKKDQGERSHGLAAVR